MSLKNSCGSRGILLLGGVALGILGYSAYRAMKSRQLTMRDLAQESSSLPLEHQYEPMYKDPKQHLMLTSKSVILKNPLKQYVPVRDAWVVQYHVPNQGDQLWQVKLSGPGVADAFKEAALLMRTNDVNNVTQVTELSKIKRPENSVMQRKGTMKRTRNVIYLDNGDVVLQFLDQPLYTRNQSHMDLHVLVFLESAYEPQSVNLEVMYGKIGWNTKRDYGHVENHDYVSADGKRFRIKSINGRAIVMPDPTSEPSDPPMKWTLMGNRANKYDDSVATQYIALQRGGEY